jgi:aminoglycoside phosphotransferase (APT) family kinase protein
MEQKLIKLARQYIMSGDKKLLVAIFDFAAQVADPQTEAGRAIIAWIKSEELAGFTLEATNEYIAIVEAL